MMSEFRQDAGHSLGTVQLGPKPYKLMGVLEHAFSMVPYYRKAFRAAGLFPGDFTRSLDRFNEIPFLTKDVVVNRRKELIAQGVDLEQLSVEFTSGSTGARLQCVRSSIERLLATRHLWKARLHWNRELLNDRQVLIMPKFGGFDPSTEQFLGRRHETLIVDLESGSEEGFNGLVDRLNKTKPALITGAVLVIQRLAELISQGVVQRLEYRPKLIEVFMERLPPRDRELICENLSAPVSEAYACRECYTIGYTCPRMRMHVLTENVYLELLSPSIKDDCGEAVVTSLTFRNMPFIRYRLGDVIALESNDCTCGLATPIISVKQGRASDKIPGYPGLLGSFVFSMMFNDLLESGYDSINKFRVTQTSLSSFEVQVVVLPGFGTATEAEIRRRMISCFGNISVTIRPVTQLSLHESGKNTIFQPFHPE